MRRRLALTVLVAAALLIGAAALWSQARSGDDGRVLVLDARTGAVLHERSFTGGFVVVALLRGGRVAVAHVDSCPGDLGGAISVWDAALGRQISGRKVAPCIVARLEPRTLRERLGDTPGLGARVLDGGITLPFADGGRIVESLRTPDDVARANALTRYDAAGRVLWRRVFADDTLGIADARDGRIVVPLLGGFTPGSD